jgi:SAM-dependent methyltransferase
MKIISKTPRTGEMGVERARVSRPIRKFRLAFLRLVQVLRAPLAGLGSQRFLESRWIGRSLALGPSAWRRGLALRFLSLSPHYFYRTPLNSELTNREFLISEFRRNAQSRRRILHNLLRKTLDAEQTVLDYGCGAGFLARAVSDQVRDVLACDISTGVLECARVLNGAPNITYVPIDRGGLIPVPNASVDLIYSFAVIQHVTDDVFRSILDEWWRVLRPGAVVICQIVLNADGWKSETQWRADRSLRGRLRWRFGLHCFSRSRDGLYANVTAAGFSPPEIAAVAASSSPLNDDMDDQHLCTFTKPES